MDHDRLSTDPAYGAIVKARVKLLFEEPFYGQLASRMEALGTASGGDVLSTDGRRLFYNPRRVLDLSQGELAAALEGVVMMSVSDAFTAQEPNEVQAELRAAVHQTIEALDPRDIPEGVARLNEQAKTVLR